jgi:hypothetical protein
MVTPPATPTTSSRRLTPANDASASPNVPDIDGTFRIVTDGDILANNTDEGPQAGPGGKVLQWRITKRTTAAPMALVRLVP